MEEDLRVFERNFSTMYSVWS